MHLIAVDNLGFIAVRCRRVAMIGQFGPKIATQQKVHDLYGPWVFNGQWIEERHT